MWSALCVKENLSQRNGRALERHPKLTKDMRTMLLEWIIEVFSLADFLL